ncbi:MAG: ABC transporter permease [Clostridia bacterium]
MNKFKEKLRGFAKPFIAIIIAFIICWLILVISGYDAPKAFGALWNSGFKNIKSFGTVLNKTSPILFTGIAVAFAFRGNVFNIGAEGQLLLGAAAATWVGTTFTSLPSYLLIPLILLSGAIAGAAFAYIPGYLKAKHGVSEVITTIMFNYIALQFIGFLVRGPFKDTSQMEPQSHPIAASGFLPYIIPGTKLHIGFVLGIVFAIIISIILFKTYFGYEVRAVGFNPMAAKTGGIAVERTMITTMLISGALAGIGGAIELAGTTHYLLEGISPGYGFTAIAVSILAANNPIGVIFSAFLFGLLSAGATSMQRAADVSASFVNIFQGVIIIFISIAAVKSVGHKKLSLKKGGN